MGGSFNQERRRRSQALSAEKTMDDAVDGFRVVP
jgi:hypothetical protein